MVNDDDDFLKFDANEKQEDSQPNNNSVSLAFGGDQPGNLSNILNQSNPFSKRMETNQDRNNGDSKNDQSQMDMFKPHDKLFLNDMSNIMRIEEQLTQRSIDGNTGNNTS